MKKTKIIIPALGMLLLSTAASVTGTVAWFSMNNYVTAQSMQVKARAENGIVISNQPNATGQGITWKENAESLRTAALALKPTSTADASTWVHSTSNDAADENTGNDYELLNTKNGWGFDTTTGAGYIDDNGTADFQSADANNVPADSMYYAMHTFYIKSSAEAITSALYVNAIKVVTNSGESATSADLDKALRVLIKLNSGSQEAAAIAADNATAKVYSPMYAAASYDARTSAGKYAAGDGAASKVTVTPIAADQSSVTTPGIIATANQQFLASREIPAATGTPLRIDIYLYFEGEDPNCKSDNLKVSLDNLNVDVTFGTKTK